MRVQPVQVVIGLIGLACLGLGYACHEYVDLPRLRTYQALAAEAEAAGKWICCVPHSFSTYLYVIGAVFLMVPLLFGVLEEGD